SATAPPGSVSPASKWHSRQVGSPNPPVWAGGGPFLKDAAPSASAPAMARPKLGNARRRTWQLGPADGVVVAPEPDDALARVEHHVADGAAAAGHVRRRQEAVRAGVEADEAVGLRARLDHPDAILVVHGDRVGAGGGAARERPFVHPLGLGVEAAQHPA